MRNRIMKRSLVQDPLYVQCYGLGSDGNLQPT